jgi:CheY-like chemotaxis protein
VRDQLDLEVVSDTACTTHAGHRILVVDDNRSLREALVTLLEGRGFGARGVANGREALQTLRGGFDACLILLDMTMPIMDGRKFRAAQQQDPALADIPVVVMAALSDPGKTASELGAVGGLAKPIADVEPLVRLVSDHCPRAAANRTSVRAGDRAAQSLTVHNRDG